MRGKGLQIKGVELVGGAKMEWHQSDDAMEVILPGAGAGEVCLCVESDDQ